MAHGSRMRYRRWSTGGEHLKFSRQVVLEWSLLLLGLVFVTIGNYKYIGPPVTLVVLIVAFVVRANRTGRILPRTGLEIPWLLFLGSALIATFIAIYPMVALLQFSRLVAAFVLYYALVESGYRIKRMAAWGLAFAGGAVALYWPLTHQFVSDPGKIPPLRVLGLLVNRILPTLPGVGLSANVVGGMMAVVLPFTIALIWISKRHRRRRGTRDAVLLTLMVSFGVLLTSSRGALIGLAAAGGAALLVYTQLRLMPRNPQKTRFWVSVTVVIVLLISVLALSGLLERLVGSVPDPEGSLQSRMQIWRQGSALIGDYVFTGAGLGSFSLLFSIYRLLIHVPFHEHMHNIFLETWFEQGILGMAAMLWGAVVVGSWAWRGLSLQVDPPRKVSLTLRALGWAGMAALVAAGVHGMVDVVFYLKRTMPLMGLVLGFAYQVTLAPGVKVVRQPLDQQRVRTLSLGAAAALLLLGVLFIRPLLSAAFANAGAVAQTLAEMRRYNPNQYDEPSLDVIRRQEDLSQAEAGFSQALLYNSANRTALQRQAQIDLSRRDFSQALQRMQSARSAGLDDEVTRLLYADALAANGYPDQAAQEVVGIGWAPERLQFQAWYRYWRNGDFPRAKDAWSAALLLEPENEEVGYWLEQAQSRLKSSE